MIDKMELVNWELQQNDNGEFKINLNLMYKNNQFGGSDNEKTFRELIEKCNAYYNGGCKLFISTYYDTGKNTYENLKKIMKVIENFNGWVRIENFLRHADKDFLRKKVSKLMYPVPEKED
ncbi:MAG: hypothetical protein ACKVE3_07015 [Dissulfuribacterales bacterium]